VNQAASSRVGPSRQLHMCPDEVRLGCPPAPHSAAISYLVLSTFPSTAASDQSCLHWDRSRGSSKRKSTFSDHLLTCKRYQNFVCVLRRSDLCLPAAAHWATISCVELSTSASTAASDQLHFVWNGSKRISTVSDHLLTCKRYYNLVCVLRRSDLC
jgi:hypothetical protein